MKLWIADICVGGGLIVLVLGLTVLCGMFTPLSAHL